MPSTRDEVKSKDAGAETEEQRKALLESEIDMGTFEQILEMDDDDDDHDFSKSIVFDFFGQAESTFKKMEVGLTEEDLPALSSLGHFLKGSSATLGMSKVKDSCEKIQHCGARKDETGMKDEPDDQKSLDRIRKTLAIAKADFERAEAVFRRFYDDL